MTSLGFNYRLAHPVRSAPTAKLPGWIARRQALAAVMSGCAIIRCSRHWSGVTTFPRLPSLRVQVPAGVDRGGVLAPSAPRVGVNVHYRRFTCTFYRERFGDQTGSCPSAEEAYERILSLPIFPLMSEQDVNDVVAVADDIASRLLKT